MSLTDEQKKWQDGTVKFWQAKLDATAAPLLERIAELEKQLEAARKDSALVRNEALEEAAETAQWTPDMMGTSQKIAAAIRSMKSDVGNTPINGERSESAA